MRHAPIFAALALASTIACGGGDASPKPAAAPKSSLPTLDDGAWLACRKFEPLARDVNAGVLSNAEFRTGLKDVYEQASVYPGSEVTRASQALLRVLTIGGNDSELKTTFLALVSACAEWDRRK